MGGGGTKTDAFQNWGTGNSLEQLYAGNAAQNNAVLSPTLTQDVVNPQGYSPTQKAAMTTAAEQTAGGTNAGATGGALLRAARTRNIGSAQPAIAGAAENAGKQLSQVNAGIQVKNADVQQQERSQGERGLEGLYGENVNAGNQDLGLSNQALENTKYDPWLSILGQGIQSAGQVGSAYYGHR